MHPTNTQKKCFTCRCDTKKKIPLSKRVTEGGKSAGRKGEEDKQNLQKSLMGPSGWQQRETVGRKKQSRQERFSEKEDVHDYARYMCCGRFSSLYFYTSNNHLDSPTPKVNIKFTGKHCVFRRFLNLESLFMINNLATVYVITLKARGGRQ